jgi:hypothetical protein
MVSGVNWTDEEVYLLSQGETDIRTVSYLTGRSPRAIRHKLKRMHLSSPNRDNDANDRDNDVNDRDENEDDEDDENR